MRKYAKVVDDKKKLVFVGSGINHDFYESIGMKLIDVYQSDVDSNWYIKDYAPIKSDKDKRKDEINDRITELQHYLNDTDWYCARYVDVGAEIPADVKDQRAAARDEIDALREELENLKIETD